MASPDIKYIVAIMVAALVLALFFGRPVDSEVTLHNSTDEPLTDVKLYAAERLIWQGRIETGDSKVVEFNAETDGTLRATGNMGHKAFDSDGLGYVTPNGRVFHTVTFESDGTISYAFLARW